MDSSRDSSERFQQHRTSVLQSGTAYRHTLRRRTGTVRVIVTCKRAGIGAPVIGKRQRPVRGHDVHIEIDQPFTSCVRSTCSHAVRGMAHRTTKAVIDVSGMQRPAGIGFDLVLQIVTLATKRVRSIHAEVRIREQIRDRLPRQWSLAELVTTLQ